jgi:hypothetical protein
MLITTHVGVVDSIAVTDGRLIVLRSMSVTLVQLRPTVFVPAALSALDTAARAATRRYIRTR